jgi:hypothetical protein
MCVHSTHTRRPVELVFAKGADRIQIYLANFHYCISEEAVRQLLLEYGRKRSERDVRRV